MITRTDFFITLHSSNKCFVKLDLNLVLCKSQSLGLNHLSIQIVSLASSGKSLELRSILFFFS